MSEHLERTASQSGPFVNRRHLFAGTAAAIVGAHLLPSTGSAQSEAVLRVGMTGDGSTLDPASWTNINERHFIPAMFDNLIDIDQNMNLVPGLASSWSTSEDGLVWTFTLNDGILFHDGTPCDAEAVVFNFNWVLDEANAIRHRADISVVSGAEVIDRLTFAVTLSQPFTPFLASLTEAVGYISSPAAIQEHGADYGSHPVGTGPFRLVEWRKDSELRLERNDQYWREGLPVAAGVSFLPIPETSVKLTNLRAGSLDIVDELATADADTVENDAALQLFTLPGSRWPIMRLNTIKAPFDNVLLRQAVTHATPRDGIIQVIFFGRARPAYGPISPLYADIYDPNVADYGLQYDLDAARARLAEAGVPDGFSFTLDIGSTPQVARLAELFQASFAQVGIQMEITPQESAAFTERLRGREFEAALGSWTPRPDVDGTIYQHFHTNGLANWVSYSNPELDTILDETRSAPIGPERNELFRQAQRILIDQAPWVYIVFEDLTRAARAEVTGYEITPDTLLHLQHVGVS